MGVRFPSAAAAQQAGNITVGQNVETIVATSPPLNIPLDFAQVFLFWCVNWLTPASTTGYFWKLRRGTTVSGAQLNITTTADAVAAATQVFSSGCYIDTPGAVAGQQYILTLTTVAATATGTSQDAMLIALVL